MGFEKEADANEILEKSDNIMHCQAIITASKGKSFYGTVKRNRMPYRSKHIGIKRNT